MKRRRKRVLLLGAAGRIGTGFREEYLEKYKEHYELILGVHDKKFKDENFKILRIELGDIKVLEKAMKNVDVVINLAANPHAEATFNEILKPNLIGAYNVFEAARKAGCERVVFASSVHAINAYPHSHKVMHEDTPKPLDFYGASKAFGEALCSVFAYHYGVSCLAIRIGAYVSNNRKKVVCYTRHDYDYVISQRDMAQLLHRCVMASKKVRYGILSGISNNEHKRMELIFTKKLIGYNPEDDAFEICKAIKKSKLKK